MNFKFKIEKKDNQIKGIAFSNREIHSALFNELNKACHNAVNKYNGNLDWCDSFIKFEYDGLYYEQIKGYPCKGCIFDKNKCRHPYFETKPNCVDKIYKES